MNLKISFKHFDHTPALDARIQEKSEKFERYFEGNLKVDWTCWVHGDSHWAELKLHGPGFDFFAKATADNMYKSLDAVIEKMERQVEKKKGMKKAKIHTSTLWSPKYQEIQMKIKDEEEASWALEEQAAS